ncbi:MAG: hypothetical protein MN733_03180, partial [Nitrososphaera sp.]|nr:hypothetical protein [Nitrososphaera sp.]
ANTARHHIKGYVVDASNISTSIACTGSGGGSDATVGIMFAFRGMEPIQITTTVNNSNGNSTNPDPPSVTSTMDSEGFVITCDSAVNDSSPGTVTNYPTTIPGLRSVAVNESGTDMSMAMAWRVRPAAGAENPAAFSTWATGQWLCETIAVEPWGIN